MKGMEEIKGKIRTEADAAAKAELAAAKEQVKQLNAKQKAFQNDYRSRYEERTKALADGLMQRRLAQARLEVKKEFLQAREEIINELIGEVLKELDRKSDGYERYLESTLANLDHLAKATVRCSKEDLKAVERLVGDKAAVRTDEKLTGGLVFEDTTGKRIDSSIATLLERRRDAIRKEVAAIIR